ncbi:lipoprotein [Streptomyces sp. BPTC-684]|uniref:lipoprotein n=1 Tax=Streptomyces sp. BPTC-684 TaxID=3043734 RepID=UPI0024B23D97|nr:lipoprotein [Streptomyces sp. BPTC-684]WHM40896.1 lipoprotein [Streptomyces sp. BPTC-684]
MRILVRGAVAAALAAAVLTGCGGEKESSGKPAATPTQASSEASEKASGAPVAEGGNTVGAAGSACPLPVAFTTADKWKAKAIKLDGTALDALAKQGPFTMACEIDAKPAGNIGFLRAWTSTAKGGTPRAALEAFVTADKNASKAAYTEIKAGSLPATEVVYETYSKLLDESKQEHALAVITPSGAVVLHLGGMDTDEHKEMLPAYELAKKSLRATSQ